MRVSMRLRCSRVRPGAHPLRYASAGAGAFDLPACVDAPMAIDPRGPAVRVPTGWSFEVPEGWVMLLFSRSGHAAAHRARLANCVGVIDSDYRGEVCVLMTRDSYDDPAADVLVVSNGSRIAQALLVQAPMVYLEEVASLTPTERGAGGFGSTGS